MSTVDQLTLGSRDSSYSLSGTETDFQYRPIPSLVPVSMGLVCLSLLAGVWDVLLIVPIVGAIISFLALRKIQRAREAFSGSGLALTCLVAQVAMVVGFGSMHAYSYATELPTGFERINFSRDISTKGFVFEGGRAEIHPDVLDLVDKKVMIKGYMYPSKETTNLSKFVLCRDNGDCCFGGQPKPSDMILIKMNDE
ncbi:MAG: hypothetical protein FJ267_06310, partial [Planctomycetes bacterium]|nr:hypothetical protein [Planctomycetota bacterium]